MEHRDLLRQAEDLRELLQHPGWGVLQELVGVQAEFVRHVVDRDPDRMAAMIVKDAVDAARVLGRAGGELRGFKTVLEIPVYAVEKADAVQAIIDSEGEGA
jgi:hypothetical protein